MLSGRFGIAITAVVLLTCGVSARAVVIDTFEDGQDLSVNSDSRSDSGSVTGGMLGGSRDLDLKWINGSNPPDLSEIDAQIDEGGNGAFVYAADYKAEGRVTLDYDGDNSPAAFEPDGLVDSGAGADLKGSSATHFHVDVTFSDQLATLNFQVRSPDNDTATASLDLDTVPVRAGGATFELAFDDFTGYEVDFSNIGALRISFEAQPGLDMGISRIATAPAPAALPGGLALLGTLGLIRGRRRRRTA